MRTLIAAAAALAAGCLGGLKNEAPAPNIYRIDAPGIPAGAALPADLSIVVERVAPGLDSDRIAGRWPGMRLDYLAGARWAGELAALLQSALVTGFQDSARLRSVQGDVGRFRATHALVIEVRRFEADYTGGGPPVAQVELAATVGRLADARVLASFTAAASESAAENRQTTVVAALNAAFAQASGDLSAKALESVAADLAGRASPSGGDRASP
ncbi:MAG TPA: ABC-type transport auxiliary lipoprotein family protein [Steroidobacteraceae bacterium]|nr:ABC-type transport auxiliary lipoprotein family protein [Steroidobacteraceae bacterium]